MKENKPNDINSKKIFFTKFFREFRLGLRSEEQPLIDMLIQDLTAISLIIPPSSTNHQYSFREILMLIILQNQKTINLLLEKK